MNLVIPRKNIRDLTSSIPTACRMDGLRRWSPETHLMGVVFADGTISLDGLFFSCCGSSGFDFSTQNSEVQSVNGCRSCGLTEKTARLSDLCLLISSKLRISQVAPILGIPKKEKLETRIKNFPLQQDLSLRRSIEKWRTKYAAQFQQNHKGRLVADSESLTFSDSKVASTNTWIGLASLIWHDGIRPLVHVHGKGNPPLGSWTEALQKKSADAKNVIVLESVHNLWEPSLLDEFDQIVSFASQTQTPLWIFLSPRESNEESGMEDLSAPKNSNANSQKLETPKRSAKFSTNIAKRMDQSRRGPIEKWLSVSTLQKLSEVCDLPNHKSP